MTNAQKEQLAREAIEMYENGVSVHIPRKNALMLFGAVVVANVATVFVLQAIPIVAKRFVPKKDDTDDGERIPVA